MQQSDQNKNNNETGHPYEDGFLICTQLVKTGGADQGGLQVGDVFVKFGPYAKDHFPGLRSIAALVRRSATVPINCVVWRKLETNGKNENENNNDENTNENNKNENSNNNKNNNNENKNNNNDKNDSKRPKLDLKNNKESVDDNGVKTIFQKLELKLTPLESHDADGGGVLGSVINTWPLPEMRG